jgi:hypothetical protein
VPFEQNLPDRLRPVEDMEADVEEPPEAYQTWKAGSGKPCTTLRSRSPNIARHDGSHIGSRGGSGGTNNAEGIRTPPAARGHITQARGCHSELLAERGDEALVPSSRLRGPPRSPTALAEQRGAWSSLQRWRHWLNGRPVSSRNNRWIVRGLAPASRA